MKQDFTENDDSKKSKKFYSFIKAKRSDIVGVSLLVDLEDVTYISDKKTLRTINLQVHFHMKMV